MMSRTLIGLSVLLAGGLFCVTNANADETTSTTTVNPITQESTTTSVNPNTQETTITKTNPNTQVTTTTVIKTPVPSPQEVVPTPEGYSNCFKVAAGWFQNSWIPEHTVCQYNTNPQGSAWVEGHWTCTKYTTAEGACTKWEWNPGHWVKTFQVY